MERPGDKQQRPGVMIILLPAQKFLRGRVRQITRREDVRQRLAGELADAAALGEVRFNEGPVRAVEFAERMQRLHHARALRPAAAHAGGERDHGEFAAREGGEAGFAKFLRQRRGGVQDIRVVHVLDIGAGGQAVLREADAAVFQIVANLLVLHAVEAVLFEQFGEALLLAAFAFSSAAADGRTAFASCRQIPDARGRRR